MYEYPDRVCKAIISLKFKSDTICNKLILALTQGRLTLPCTHKAILTALQLNSHIPLEEICRLAMHHMNSDPQLLFFVHTQASSVIENLSLNCDNQLRSCVTTLSLSHCSSLIQPIWNYLISRITECPSYVLPEEVQNVLENAEDLDCKFLLRWGRILGILKVEFSGNESIISLPTRKI